MKKHHGVSLIEVLAVMTVTTVMLSVAVGLLNTLLRTERATREHLRQQAVLGRLAGQFRDDAHAALRLVLPQGDAPQQRRSAWQFEPAPGESIRYHVEDGYLVRTEQAKGKPPRRESFRLPIGTTVLIRRREQDKTDVTSMLIVPAEDPPAGSTCRSIRIDAALASNHRFTKPIEPKEPQP